jgi:hypothetical protein
MNIIDLLNDNTRLTLPQVNRLPRIKGRTQITAKTHATALADNGLALEPETERPGPDYDLAPPQLIDGVVQPQQWIKREITPEQIEAHRTSVLQQIDAAVSDWRVAQAAPGHFIAAEYELKRKDAEEYLLAYATDPRTAVPPLVQAVATRYKLTADEAAALIGERAGVLTIALRYSTIIRDEQKGICEVAEDMAAIDQALIDVATRLGALVAT